VTAPIPRPRLLRRSSWPERRFIANALRTETVGGVLLLLAAIAALGWANSPWRSSYRTLRSTIVGPHVMHLSLSLQDWAGDGLLAVFFFVAGLELKREFVVGELRDRTKAALPIAAAACGVALPALLFLVVATTANGSGDNRGNLLRGWAIPTATDIAFALAVLAVLGAHLPSALRSFLLTLAVVDDLIAIVIIAIVYTDRVDLRPLALALLTLVGFWLASRIKPVRWLLAPLGLATWGLVHASGVHPTVAGVALALTVSCRVDDSDDSLAQRLEHRLRPLSAGLAVPVFALMSAGVAIGGVHGLKHSLADPAALGVVVGLVAGKAIGVFAGTYLVARFTKATLDDDLAWIDVLGLALLSGIGFTVSLLIGGLAYGGGSSTDDHVKIAVLAASVVSALCAALVLRLRNRHYRLIHEDEANDRDDAEVLDIKTSPPGNSTTA
jgi:NhaA family Na+:H+ antiporter